MHGVNEAGKAVQVKPKVTREQGRTALATEPTPYSAAQAAYGSKNMHPILNPSIPFRSETESDAIDRYKGFAADFFPRLYQAWPALQGQFHFFKDPWTQDLWSVCHINGQDFGVQLDPDIEVICLWDANWHLETGTWQNDPVGFVIQTIQERYLPASA